MKIANRDVQIGDDLYWLGKDRWGKVVRLESSAAVVRFTQQDQTTSDVIIQEGGFYRGSRQFYWHTPIALDLPFRDISRYQYVLDCMKEVL